MLRQRISQNIICDKNIKRVKRETNLNFKLSPYSRKMATYNQWVELNTIIFPTNNYFSDVTTTSPACPTVTPGNPSQKAIAVNQGINLFSTTVESNPGKQWCSTLWSGNSSTIANYNCQIFMFYKRIARIDIIIISISFTPKIHISYTQQREWSSLAGITGENIAFTLMLQGYSLKFVLEKV